MYNAHEYDIKVEEIQRYGRTYFVARIAELPHVIEYGDTWQEAYDLAIDTIQITQEIMADQMLAPINAAYFSHAPAEDNKQG